MTTRERKLLRKEINLKLKHLANNESDENDFLNSSQILTERQQMYMTISKHFRAHDNRRKISKLPFCVERMSLPHVNMSLLNRLYQTTDTIMKSDKLDEVLNAHSYRVKTPFYTNPELTIDRGKVMNYSAHVGAILHTPRYIDFMKNTPEYSTTIKIHQPQGRESQRRSVPSESCSERSTVASSIHSQSVRSRTETSHSNIIAKSNVESKENPCSERLQSISRHSSASVKGKSPIFNEKSSLKSSARSFILQNSQGSDAMALEESVCSKSNDDVAGNISAESEKFDKSAELSDKRNSSTTIPDLAITDQASGEANDGMEDDLANEAVEIALLHSERSLNHDFFIRDVDNFFRDKIMKDEDWDAICHYFDIVDMYRLSRPSYVKDYGETLLTSYSPHFQEFHRVITRYNVSAISDDESKYISTLIKEGMLQGRRYSMESQSNRESSHTNDAEEGVTISKGEHSVSSKEAKEENDEPFEKATEERNTNDNLLETLQRIFPIEDIKENYDIKIDSEDPEDEDDLYNSEDDVSRRTFTKSFGSLFRNSVDVMNEDDINNLKRLIAELDYEGNSCDTPQGEEHGGFFKEFKELFLTVRKDMSTDDIVNLNRLLDNDLGGDNDDNVQDFETLLVRYHGRISDGDLHNAKRLVQRYERGDMRRFSYLSVREDETINQQEEEILEEKKEGVLTSKEDDKSGDCDNESLLDEEENETMLAFRNLFRTSVGEITKVDIDHIMDMINEHYGDGCLTP